MIALVGAYDEILCPAHDPGPRGGRRAGLLVPRPFLRLLLVRHVDRTLAALTRRLHARAAIAGRPGAADPAVPMLDSYRQSLPIGWWSRHAVFALAAGTFLVAYVLASHVFRTSEAALLQHLTTAMLTLDRGRAVDALNSATVETVGGAAVIALWALAVMLVVPVLAQRRMTALLSAGAAGTLEREAFAAIGSRAPAELPLHLLARATLAVSVLSFGIGVLLFGLTDPHEQAQLGPVARYLVGGSCLALGAAALAGLAAAAAGRRHAALRWLVAATYVVFASLVAVALGSR